VSNKGVEMTTTDAWEQETEQAWEALESQLATWLQEVPLDETVLIELAWPEGDVEKVAPYVQLYIEGLTVRSEAASNYYLEPRFRLDETRVEQLRALGWGASREDCRNFWRQDEVPGDGYELAAILVATLRDIYGVPAPSFLVTSGFGESGPLSAEELPFGLTVTGPDRPSVDLTVNLAEDADELRDLVAAVVSTVASVAVEFDPDGDIPLPAGNTVVYVRVEESEPAVTLFAALLRDVSWTPRVGHTLNDVNQTIRYGRVVFHAGHVLLEYRVFCRPFVPEVLRHAVHGMTELVDGLDVRLQGTIGGRILSDHQDGVA
jgi:hypothetical protein